MKAAAARRIARIDPQRCIGCTRCIDACPFDAIIGAPQRMHTVVDALCIGCELCVAPCPVDCIELAAAPAAGALTRDEAIAARSRRSRRAERLAHDAAAAAAGAASPQDIVAAALRRARERAASPRREP